MKILFVTWGPIDKPSNGAQYYSSDYVKLLKQRNEVKTIEVIGEPNKGGHSDNKIFLKSNGIFANLEANLKLLLLMGRKKMLKDFDLVFSESSYFFIFMLFCKILEKNIIYDTNQFDIEFSKNIPGLVKIPYLAFSVISDFVMYISSFALTFVSEVDKMLFFKYFKNKLHYIIPVHINTAAIVELEEDAKLKLKINLGLKDKEFICLFVGPTDTMQNKLAVDFLVHNVAPKIDDMTFLLVGKGNNIDFKNIKSFGFVENVNQYFEIADILVNPVVAGSGIKTKNLEALFHNLPVLTTKLGADGIEDLINNGLFITNLESFPETLTAMRNKIKENKCNINKSLLEIHTLEFFEKSISQMMNDLLNIFTET